MFSIRVMLMYALWGSMAMSIVALGNTYLLVSTILVGICVKSTLCQTSLHIQQNTCGLFPQTWKRKCCHFDEIFVIWCTGSCIKWQLLVEVVIEISWKWHFGFSEYHGLTSMTAWKSYYIHYQVREWISNFIPRFAEHVITYSCWDWS